MGVVSASLLAQITAHEGRTIGFCWGFRDIAGGIGIAPVALMPSDSGTRRSPEVENLAT